MSSIKICFNGETKRIKKPVTYFDLLKSTSNIFKLPDFFKFVYLDEDNDKITITTNDDLEEAFSSVDGPLKLMVEERDELSMSMYSG